MTQIYIPNKQQKSSGEGRLTFAINNSTFPSLDLFLK